MIPTEIVWTSVHTHDANVALIEATCSLPLQCTVLILPFTPAAKKKHLKTTIIVLQVFGAVVSQALRIYLFA